VLTSTAHSIADVKAAFLPAFLVGLVDNCKATAIPLLQLTCRHIPTLPYTLPYPLGAALCRCRASRPPRVVTYLHVHEDADLSLGIFCLPRGACLPLHNHPNMTVLSRCARARPAGPRGGRASLVSLRMCVALVCSFFGCTSSNASWESASASTARRTLRC